MSHERATPAQWDVLTAELRSYREQQKQTWGELDNALIGRYLAGEVTDDERRTVETALKDHPELRKLTDLVLDVLNEFQPSSSETPASLPRLLPFTDRRQMRRPFLSRIRERGALLAAACVLLALGVTLLKVPGPGPVTHVARRYGSPVAHLMHPKDLLADDDFPVPAQSVSSIRPEGAADAVGPARMEEIDKVAAWTERRLRTPLVPPSSPPQPPSLMMAPPGGGKGAEFKVAAPARASAIARKDRRSHSRELERATPYLVQGVCQGGRPALRDRCKALVRLAPFAGDAVPLLKKALQQPASPGQQKIIVEALKNLGPAANDAAPLLARLAERGPANMRAEAREALRCVCCGVNDQGQVFSPEACRRLNECAARLSRRHHVNFSAQTYRRQEAGLVRNLARQVQAANGRGLSVVICADSQAVEVTLSPDLNGKDSPLNEEALRKLIRTNLQSATPERGLEQAVELVERSLSQRERPRR